MENVPLIVFHFAHENNEFVYIWPISLQHLLTVGGGGKVGPVLHFAPPK